MKEDQELRSLKRGLKVLALLNQTETVSITELARIMDLPRTTAERIMLTLVAEGYVRRVPDDKRYRLSAKVCALSGGFSDDCWIIEAAMPILHRVTQQIGWPLAIATPAGDHMVLRATTDPATSLWLSRRRVGAEIAMLNSSSGLVAFAHAAPGRQEAMRQMLAESADPFNRERAGNLRMLEMLAEPVRQNGFAFQPPPNNNPEQSIAFPVFVGGRYVASLLMIYMTRALTGAMVVERFAPQLRRLADRIGEAAASHEEVDADFDFDLPKFGTAAAPVRELRAW